MKTSETSLIFYALWKDRFSCANVNITSRYYLIVVPWVCGMYHPGMTQYQLWTFTESATERETVSLQ